MAVILTNVSHRDVAEAIEANDREFWLGYGRCRGSEIRDDPELTWFSTRVRDPLFNGVLRANFPSADWDGGIASVVQMFRDRRRPFEWSVRPRNAPANLPERLQAHGFRKTLDAPAMAIDLRTLPESIPTPGDFVISPVTDRKDLRIHAGIAFAAFGISPATRSQAVKLEMELGRPHERLRFLGRLGGRPIATATLFLGAGVAGLYFLATAPEARGRGVGTAMLVHALRQAETLGFRVGVLQATPPGLSIYRRLGFLEHYVLELYTWRDAGDINKVPDPLAGPWQVPR